MTDTDATAPESEAVPTDVAREALLAAMTEELGDAIVGSHLMPGTDLWVRVTPEAWGLTATYLHDRQRFRFFSFLSVIDWLPSPFGRSMDAMVDKAVVAAEAAAEGESAEDEATDTAGYAGADTRFQVFARVHSLSTGIGVNVRADIPDDTLTVPTWTNDYSGADWHEREAAEMFGVRFDGHPGLRPIYLPGDFEGHPLRKDFPLLARMVKPWPGIVDVEPMPEEASDAPAASATNTEAGDAAPEVS